MDIDVDVDVNRHFRYLKQGSRSVQVLLNGIEAVMALTLMIRKQQTLITGLSRP